MVHSKKAWPMSRTLIPKPQLNPVTPTTTSLLSLISASLSLVKTVWPVSLLFFSSLSCFRGQWRINKDGSLCWLAVLTGWTDIVSIMNNPAHHDCIAKIKKIFFENPSFRFTPISLLKPHGLYSYYVTTLIYSSAVFLQWLFTCLWDSVRQNSVK